MEFFSQLCVWVNTDSSLCQTSREKEREGQKGKIRLWTNSVSQSLTYSGLSILKLLLLHIHLTRMQLPMHLILYFRPK